MDRYASTIITQFINFSNCEIEKDEGRSEKTISVYFRNGRKKTFRGNTWNSVAYEMAGFMRQPYFKKLYIEPLFSSERWIIDDSLI